MYYDFFLKNYAFYGTKTCKFIKKKCFTEFDARANGVCLLLFKSLLRRYNENIEREMIVAGGNICMYKMEGWLSFICLCACTHENKEQMKSELTES